MKHCIPLALAACALTPGQASAQTPFPRTFEPHTRFELSADLGADPVCEIRAHLAAVIADLRARDVSGLSDTQRARRAARIQDLADYARRGIFPRNDVADIPTPIFIDSGGRACAVGHLMIASGAADLARQVSRVQNFAYVPEITVPGVPEWIERSGLTPDECAQIQPSYPCGNPLGPPLVGSQYICGTWNNPGHLAGCGSGVAGMNALFFEYGVTENSIGLLVNSRTMGMVIAPGGSQGNLCLGGAIGRDAAGPFMTGTFGEGYVSVDLTAMPTPTGFATVMAGDSWNFQVWYREGASSNFTNGVTITFM